MMMMMIEMMMMMMMMMRWRGHETAIPFQMTHYIALHADAVTVHYC